MKDKYNIKVGVARLTFMMIVILCIFLVKFRLTDYLVLMGLIVFPIGLISVSRAEVTSDQIKIRKNYFWAIFELTKNISFKQLRSIRTKNYEMETHEDAWMLTEGFFSFFVVEYFRPKIKWLITKMTYLENGVEKTIEFRLSKDEFKTIEQKIGISPNNGL